MNDKIYADIKQKEIKKMANRFVLNETSYHGKGAIAILTEAKSKRIQKKSFSLL